MGRLQMREVGVPVAVDLEHRDVGWIVLVGHRVEDENTRLQPNGSFDLLVDRRLVGLQLRGIDFDFSNLNVLLCHRLTHRGHPEQRQKEYHAESQNLL